jgi:DNA mismatch repair protein MutS
MLLDDSAVRNLELVQGAMTKTTENSLLEVLDHTCTSMGSRMLRKLVLQPLTNVDKIKQRQNTTKFFVYEGVIRRNLKDLLKSVCDIERVLGRIASGIANPRDVVALKNTIQLIPKIKSSTKPDANPLTTTTSVPNINLNELHEMADLVKILSESIVDEPPADITKGGVIKPGFDKELDELRKISTSGKTCMAEMEQKERQRTGINTLKIGYTSVFGYYIEITKSHLTEVPQDFIRKQTLVNAERFITQELKEFEQKVLSAEEKIMRLESDIFTRLKQEILKEKDKLYQSASVIAELDVYCSLADTACTNNYNLPEIDYGNVIDVKDCRHPVIEKKLYGKTFVPNDILLDGNQQQIIILTGPNMAGKSTYLRQVALVVIMAQKGSYVPAKQAKIGVVDRIFTRIGAADNLAGGESTFMVEMHETANILNNSTGRSLLILDEVGRGTSTFDGISIAWATVEHLRHKTKPGDTGPKVLFATHYFELTELADKLTGVKNYNVSVREWQDEVIFLHKIVPGFSDRSYGIHVAKLAGLPHELINRAKQILVEMETRSRQESDVLIDKKKPGKQLDFFAKPSVHPVETALKKLDVNNLRPIDSLKILNDWKEKYGKG